MATTSAKLQTLAALISTSGSATVFPYERKNNSTDCVVYSLISSVPFYDQSENILLTRNRVQLTCWGTSLKLSRTLAETMVELLAINTTNFELSYMIDDKTIKDLETGLYKTYIDLYIW